MNDLDKSIGWLKERVPIDDIYTPHLIFIMRDYAKKYHEMKLNEPPSNNEGVIIRNEPQQGFIKIKRNDKNKLE